MAAWEEEADILRVRARWVKYHVLRDVDGLYLIDAVIGGSPTTEPCPETRAACPNRLADPARERKRSGTASRGIAVPARREVRKGAAASVQRRGISSQRRMGAPASRVRGGRGRLDS